MVRGARTSSSAPSDGSPVRPSRSPIWMLSVGLAWTVGIVCLGAWAFLTLSHAAGARDGLNQFASMRAASLTQTSAAPDMTLWSPVRVRAWNDAVAHAGPAPLGVLRIRRLELEVPIFEGTDDVTLDRGVGHIEDTSAPGSEGNSGLAGHRDGFFRVLKDIASGDILEIETLHGKDGYRVDRTWIVEPDDVSVLDPTPTDAVTLVTCYPFYFVGSAPQRFIVRATRTAPAEQR
jgi:sortase A